MIVRYFIRLFSGIDKKSSFNYNEVETKVRTFTKNYIILFLVADLASMVLMPALVAGFYYINGTLTLNAWFLPLATMYVINISLSAWEIVLCNFYIDSHNNRTPYNQNSTIGHILSHITQTSGITAIVAFLCPITTTYSAVCSYVEALFIDLGHEHNRIDGHFEGSPRRVNVIEMKKQLIDLILSHNEVHEYKWLNSSSLLIIQPILRTFFQVYE